MEGRVLLGCTLWKGIVSWPKHRAGEKKGEQAVLRQWGEQHFWWGRTRAGAGRVVAKKRLVWAWSGNESLRRRRPLPELVVVSNLTLLLVKLILIKIISSFFSPNKMDAPWKTCGMGNLHVTIHHATEQVSSKVKHSLLALLSVHIINTFFLEHTLTCARNCL